MSFRIEVAYLAIIVFAFKLLIAWFTWVVPSELRINKIHEHRSGIARHDILWVTFLTGLVL
jgi:hypothetical protein